MAPRTLVALRGLRMVPRGFRRAQSVPTGPPDVPREAPEGSRWPQEASRWRQAALGSRQISNNSFSTRSCVTLGTLQCVPQFFLCGHACRFAPCSAGRISFYAVMRAAWHPVVRAAVFSKLSCVPWLVRVWCGVAAMAWHSTVFSRVELQ